MYSTTRSPCLHREKQLTAIFHRGPFHEPLIHEFWTDPANDLFSNIFRPCIDSAIEYEFEIYQGNK